MPDELIRYTDRFDDPNLPGEMRVTVRLKKVSVGPDIEIIQEGVPDAIPTGLLSGLAGIAHAARATCGT